MSCADTAAMPCSSPPAVPTLGAATIFQPDPVLCSISGRCAAGPGGATEPTAHRLVALTAVTAARAVPVVGPAAGTTVHLLARTAADAEVVESTAAVRLAAATAQTMPARRGRTRMRDPRSKPSGAIGGRGGRALSPSTASTPAVVAASNSHRTE